MSEKNIQQVLEIEKQAQEIHDTAVKEAQQLPIIAEQESQAIISKAKAEAEAEARKIVATAQSEDESKKILTDVDAKKSELETLAKANFNKAVAYVLERVIGRV